MLHEAVPKSTLAGFLVNPTNPYADSDTSDAQAAASALGGRLLVVKAATEKRHRDGLRHIGPTTGRLASRCPRFVLQQSQISNRCARSPPANARALPLARGHDRRRAYELWARHCRWISSRWGLCVPNPTVPQ